MTLSDIEAVLAAKDTFDRVIMRSPDITRTEQTAAWADWKRRWGQLLIGAFPKGEDEDDE